MNLQESNIYVNAQDLMNINRYQHKNYTYEHQILNTELSRYSSPFKNELI